MCNLEFSKFFKEAIELGDSGMTISMCQKKTTANIEFFTQKKISNKY